MLVLHLLVVLLGVSELALASPHSLAGSAPAPRPRFLQKSGRRAAAEIFNPLIAKRQVHAESIRSPPRKAKRACPSFISNGNCACPPETTYCPDSGDCANFDIDPANCGQCGIACPVGGYCDSGSCSCQTGEVVCDGTCTSLQSVTSCGTCGTVCPISAACISGACVCPSGIDYTSFPCDGSCVVSDSYNCGACGVECSATQECLNNQCVCYTGAGFFECDGTCVDSSDFQSDPANCGQCGITCPVGASCDSGSCTCPSGEEACSGTCTSTLTDARHCGTCGTSCGPGSCSGGVCSCGSNCNIEGLLAAVGVGSTTVICVFDGETCTEGDLATWTGSVGVSGQPLSSVLEGKKFFAFPIQADTPTVSPGQGSTGQMDGEVVTETPSGATPGTYAGGYYETDVWSILSTPVQTSAGIGYPLIATWVNPSTPPDDLSWLIKPLTGYTGYYELEFSGSYQGVQGIYTEVNLYYIPQSGS